MLWRKAGRPEASKEPTFTDISGLSEEFQGAIAWGFSEEIINGLSETVFDPLGDLTREAALKMLYYYSGGVSGLELLFTGIYDNSFEDSADISSWAKPALYWGVYNSVIQGVSETILSPKGVVTRSQMAKMLVSYMDHIEE